MLLNPELLSITQSKQMGMWPNGNTVADQMYPYVKRMKEPTVKILDIGDPKGENVYRFLELDQKGKIESIDVVQRFLAKSMSAELDILRGENLRSCPSKEKVHLNTEKKVGHYDLVCVNSESGLDTTLDMYYNSLKSGGIFCGNNHGHHPVKEALVAFRKKNKIGTPILTAFDVWFWYKREQ